MIDKRQALTPEERMRRTLSANLRLEGLDEFAAAKVIATFAPKGPEIEPTAAYGPSQERAIVYPRVTDRQPRLVFHRVKWPYELGPGAFGVREPVPPAPEVPLDQIDLFVVPGLAFDARGVRLGYGGGYYDELMAARKGRALFVGFAFDFQVVDHCPAGEGDQAVDCVVTDTRTIRP